MSAPESLERIILVPRNGLGNRLQAWSSAALIAQDWAIPLDVMWEPEVAAPTPASDLFAGAPDITGLDNAFLDRDSLDRILGADHETLPRYVYPNPGRNFVTLAGHDRGEQAFIDELLGCLHRDSRLKTLVIIAGGLFTLNPQDRSAFQHRRQDFYRAIPWHPSIQERVGESQPIGDYSALHIRQTDRSNQAPTHRVIERTLRTVIHSGGASSLFIAADTSDGRNTWTRYSNALGFDPWSIAKMDFSRSAPTGGMSAAVDWITLSRSSLLAYPGASTFSAEACVANGGNGIAMYASALTQRARSAQEGFGSILTYPKRRAWGSRKR